MVVEPAHQSADINEAADKNPASWDNLCCEREFPDQREKCAFREDREGSKVIQQDH